MLKTDVEEWEWRSLLEVLLEDHPARFFCSGDQSFVVGAGRSIRRTEESERVEKEKDRREHVESRVEVERETWVSLEIQPAR